MNIVAASDDLGNVFIRLGGFHLLMSFLGSVGNIMSGSGLEELWESVHAKGSIPQMMNGHAYSRALQAHFLTQAALSTLLFKHLNSSEGDAEEMDTDHLTAVYEGIIKKEVNVDGVLENHDVNDLLQATDNLCVHISQMSRTVDPVLPTGISDALVPSC